jgi:hypothetical protein
MKKIVIPFVAIALLLLPFSCKKENETIGLKTNEGTLQSASIDTFQLSTFSKYSQNTVSNSGSSVFIGGYHTDELGTIRNQAYTTLAPDDLNFRIAEGGITVTSVTLDLLVLESYGNPISQEFKISRTTTSVAPEDTYLTSDSLISLSTNIGTFIKSTNDTGVISVVIDKSFGEEIIGKGDVIFTTSEVFVDIFKGLSIIPTNTLTSNGGSVYAISADDIVLTINYTDNIAGTSGSVTFSPTSSSRSFYNTSLNQDAAEVEAQLTNTLLGNSNFFVQGLGSIKSEIAMPSLLAWFQIGNILINKATLTFPVTASANINYAPPTSLLVHSANDGSSVGVQGIYNADSSYYVFEIESLVSQKLLSNEEATLELSVMNSFAHPEQVNLNGGSNATSKASLVIHYTEY